MPDITTDDDGGSASRSLSFFFRYNNKMRIFSFQFGPHFVSKYRDPPSDLSIDNKTRISKKRPPRQKSNFHAHARTHLPPLRRFFDETNNNARRTTTTIALSSSSSPKKKVVVVVVVSRRRQKRTTTTTTTMTPPTLKKKRRRFAIETKATRDFG